MSSKRPMMMMIALVGTCGLGAAGASAQTLYVDDDAPAAGDGIGWVTAYRFLQDALADAAGGGITEIRVAQGGYEPDQDEAGNVTPGDREATFQLINGVALRGGYRGAYDGTGMPADDRDIDVFVTTLSGDLLGNDVGFVNNAENSYHVVTGHGTDVTAELDGFTITAGHANGPDPGNLEWVRGAGMWTFVGSPTVSNCTFDANMAQRHGGGMYNHTGSNTTVTSTSS